MTIREFTTTENDTLKFQIHEVGSAFGRVYSVSYRYGNGMTFWLVPSKGGDYKSIGWAINAIKRYCKNNRYTMIEA